MATHEALCSAVFTPTYRLPSTVAAIQASYAREGEPELGTISHLPEGAELEFCGDGFNESTLKVRWEGQSYFVFWQDITTVDPAFEPDISQLLNGTPRKPVKTQHSKRLSASQMASRTLRPSQCGLRSRMTSSTGWRRAIARPAGPS